MIENMAPVLTRTSRPCSPPCWSRSARALLWTGRGVDIEQDVLIAFDLLLVVVLGLLLYSVSARDPRSPRPPSMWCRSCWWSVRYWPTR